MDICDIIEECLAQSNRETALSIELKAAHDAIKNKKITHEKTLSEADKKLLIIFKRLRQAELERSLCSFDYCSWSKLPKSYQREFKTVIDCYISGEVYFPYDQFISASPSLPNDSFAILIQKDFRGYRATITQKTSKEKLYEKRKRNSTVETFKNFKRKG